MLVKIIVVTENTYGLIVFTHSQFLNDEGYLDSSHLKGDKLMYRSK